MATDPVVPPHHDPACWGCGDAPGGIRLPRPAEEGAPEYEAWFQFDERHQAGPGLAHGGLVAAARGAFLHVPLEHFLATPEGPAAADTWKRQLGA